MYKILINFFNSIQIHFKSFVLNFSAGQEAAKQALHEIVILPAIRPEVSIDRLYMK